MHGQTLFLIAAFAASAIAAPVPALNSNVEQTAPLTTADAFDAAFAPAVANLKRELMERLEMTMPIKRDEIHLDGDIGLSNDKKADYAAPSDSDFVEKRDDSVAVVSTTTEQKRYDSVAMVSTTNEEKRGYVAPVSQAAEQKRYDSVAMVSTTNEEKRGYVAPVSQAAEQKRDYVTAIGTDDEQKRPVDATPIETNKQISVGSVEAIAVEERQVDNFDSDFSGRRRRSSRVLGMAE